MALLKTKAAVLPLAEERRRFQRVRVNLLGRYMLADRREFPCQVTNMSPGGMAVIAPVSGQTGERVIAYVDHVGRLEGVIARQFQNGFAMTIVGDDRASATSSRPSSPGSPTATSSTCRKTAATAVSRRATRRPA